VLNTAGPEFKVNLSSADIGFASGDKRLEYRLTHSGNRPVSADSEIQCHSVHALGR
jgi:hypothetical protein